MAEDKTQKLTIGGTSVGVTEVEIVKRLREQANEYELEDGSVIRVSNPSLVVLRLEGVRDNEGNPAYYVRNGTAVIVVKGPRQGNGKDR